MIQLELYDEQAVMLRDILEAHLADLRSEIVHTEEQGTKIALKEREVFIKQMLGTLAVTADALPRSSG